MVLVNKKMLTGGMLMIIVGLVLTININAAIPIGQAGMTEEEVIIPLFFLLALLAYLSFFLHQN